jgi:uncharacterized damage-inducible protein DinB
MELTQYLADELASEVTKSRRALEEVPEGKHEWKPHDRSMIFGYLTSMVATIPSWITMIVKQDELDIAPTDGPSHQPPPMNTSADYIKALDKSAAEAAAALAGTTEEFLQTNWRLLAGGQVVAEMPRYQMIRDTINHWAHHRGQMTGATVPALYGPSADDENFA